VPARLAEWTRSVMVIVPMKLIASFRPVLVVFGLILGHSAAAQLQIPLTDVQLANASLPAVTVTLNGGSRNAIPTPFVLNTAFLPPSAQWFCLDPGQTIFHSGSGEPAGNHLNYAGTNPANFDLWGAGAPGLSTARLQDLADLFQAYLPAANTSLTLGALQLAVWEIANESDANPYALGGGFLSVTSYNGTGANAMITSANALLASLNLPSIMNQGNLASIDLLIDGSYQRIGTNNVAFVQDMVGFSPVPEPSTYGLMGAGLLAVVIGWRKRKTRRLAAPVLSA
jgi:hypothetical protein